MRAANPACVLGGDESVPGFDFNRYLASLALLSGSHVFIQSRPDSVTPWTVARQAPLSMGFSRQEY